MYGLYPKHRNELRGINKYPENKLWHLQKMMRRFSIADPHQVLLVDDDANNIESARAQGFQV